MMVVIIGYKETRQQEVKKSKYCKKKITGSTSDIISRLDPKIVVSLRK